MTTNVIISFDTELSPALHIKGWSGGDNLASSIFGRCKDGEFGIKYQMDMLDRHGLKGVFFVDPMPALVYGEDIIADIVGPIVEQGHEVQLHIHTEWLEFAKKQPVGALRGTSIKDFPLDAQITLLGLAQEILCRAGAPMPVAFRAGNYGANDDTLRALHAIGIRYDSSFNPAYIGQGCDITLPAEQIAVTTKHGVQIIPIDAIWDTQTSLRHAQICALSSREMRAAIDYAAIMNHPKFMIVTHSFELLSRNRQKLNNSVKSRFDRLCRHVGAHASVNSIGFSGQSSAYNNAANVNYDRLPPAFFRRFTRMGKQAAYKLVFE